MVVHLLVALLLVSVVARAQPNQGYCPAQSGYSCGENDFYRSYDGRCNHPDQPSAGAAGEPFTRLAPPLYEDGVLLPRTQSVLGGDLPSCRELSLALRSLPKADRDFNSYMVIYGQFMAHDMTLSAPVSDAKGDPYNQCGCSVPFMYGNYQSDPCIRIPVPDNDPYMNQPCMTLPKTKFSDPQCTGGVTEQINANTAAIDLSNIYGSSRQTAHALRLHQRGLLKTTQVPGIKYALPPAQREGNTCDDSTPDHKCLISGDSRLMITYAQLCQTSQWIRQHNEWATKLWEMHPDWSDNKIYEETKKLLVAVHQMFVYEDWLPILLGEQITSESYGNYGDSPYTQFDPAYTPTVWTEIATAALRCHSLVRDLYTMASSDGQVTGHVWLKDMVHKSRLAYDSDLGGTDAVCIGSLYDHGWKQDTNIAHQMHHQLFETVTSKGDVHRNDIFAINICRGREHGLESYNYYRQWCGKPKAERFEDLIDVMSQENIELSKQFYKHPSDMDLYWGITMERPLPGAHVGHVHACLLRYQFEHLMFGDWYFWTHEGQFPLDQLEAIKNFSLQAFMCGTLDVESVQKNPFRPPGAQNPMMRCSQVPGLDMNPWRDYFTPPESSYLNSNNYAGRMSK